MSLCGGEMSRLSKKIKRSKRGIRSSIRIKRSLLSKKSKNMERSKRRVKLSQSNPSSRKMRT